MATTTIKAKLTHKVGPLPVWAWAALALAAWFLFLRAPAKAAGGTQLPYTPTSGSGAQQPSSGQGNPVDNTDGDLLSALQDNKTAYDALLAALQYGSLGGYGGYSSGYGSGGAGSAGGVPAPIDTTSAFTAPTIDSGVNNAPAPYPNYVDYTDPSVNAAAGTIDEFNTLSSGLPIGTPVVDPGFYTYEPTPDTSDALSRYLANVTSDPVPERTVSVVSQPTPTIVQPAPVDTGGVIDTRPRPGPGQAVMV